MNLRHRLLRWLSFGDLVVMNAEIEGDVRLRSKEAGDYLIENCRIDHEKDIGLRVNYYHADVGLSLQKTLRQSICLSRTLIRRIPDYSGGSDG